MSFPGLSSRVYTCDIREKAASIKEMIGCKTVWISFSLPKYDSGKMRQILFHLVTCYLESSVTSAVVLSRRYDSLIK